MRLAVLALGSGLLSACGAAVITMDPPPDPLDVTPLRDVNPDPNVVEVQLVAGPAEVEYLAGKTTSVWAYRDGSIPGSVGTVPGPLLEAPVGARVLVHFTNDLPEDTTVHWHGVRVPNAADGTTSSQRAVAPGETFDYEFTVPDAGTFWYHPHVRGEVQIEAGLYAPLVVHGAAEDEPAVMADRVFFLDDVKIEADGQLSTETDSLDMMLGRQGNVLLVNGTRYAATSARHGTRERWRFVNSANGRYFNLTIPGRSLLVVGWDGGLLPSPYRTETLLVAPGERYDVIMTFIEPVGATLTLQTVHHDRGHHIPDPGPRDLLQIAIDEPTREFLPPLPSTWGDYAALPVESDTPVRQLTLSEEEEGLAEPRFFINGERFPDVTPLMGHVGDVEIWEIRNQAEMDHPFHLHGMFFQVLDVDGEPPAHRGWKDTVNIPQLQTLRFAVRYGGAGEWMYHCHILEHAERGMMGMLMLEEQH